jgi:hypothetical protein
MNVARAVVAAGLVLSGPTASAQLLSANEAGATGTLRSIVSGQLAFSAVCGNFFYAPSLAALARPAPGSPTGFILDTDVPPKGATVLEKYRYRIEMTAKPSPDSPASCNGIAAGGLAQTFLVTARPMPGYSGKSLQIDHEGKLTEIK